MNPRCWLIDRVLLIFDINGVHFAVGAYRIRLIRIHRAYAIRPCKIGIMVRFKIISQPFGLPNNISTG